MTFTKKLGYLFAAIVMVAVAILASRLFHGSGDKNGKKADPNVASTNSEASGADARAVQSENEESEMRARDHEEASDSAELQQIATEFKANPEFREASARRILPYLKNGMTAEEIVRLLGEPTEKSGDGSLWWYSVFYSKAIEIHFNPQGRVEKVVPVGIEAD
jgi:FtsZ-interacting cell division protein ZipA